MLLYCSFCGKRLDKRNLNLVPLKLILDLEKNKRTKKFTWPLCNDCDLGVKTNTEFIE